MNTYRALLGIVVVSASFAQGQLVFVPDVNLQYELNIQMPGVVDANGYIDPANPIVIATEELNINFQWTPASTAGIEAFHGLKRLKIYQLGIAVALSIPQLPDSLRYLSIAGQLSIGALPALPAELDSLVVYGVSGMSSLPTLPGGMTSLNVGSVQDLLVLPTLPASLLELGINDAPSLNYLPSIPTGLEWLWLSNTPLQAIPNWPTSPIIISCTNLNVLNSIPLLPAVVDSGLSLQYMPLWTLPNLPDTTYQLMLVGLPIQTMPPMPQSLQRLELTDLPELECLPVLPNDLNHLSLTSTGIDCLPNLPGMLPFVLWPTIAPVTASLLCTPLNSTCPPGAVATGAVFNDTNANGVQGPGELGLSNGIITITPGGWSFGTAPDGSYSFGLPVGTYTITAAVVSPYALGVSPADHTAVFNSVTDVDSLNDFGIVLQPGIEDLTVLLTAAPAVPGFDNTVWLSYRNVGTVPMDGSVTFTVDANQSFLSSSTAPDMQMGNTLTWDFVALAIGETRSVAIQVHTDASAPIGTTLLHSAVIDPLLTDQTPADNSAALADVVVGSYDPNDKHVLPTEATPAEVAAGLDLAYTIRFQNTGTWPASRVIITDTLSTDLQWSTFQFTASSHACTWYVQNGVAVFTFDPIVLPDSGLNEPGSHGFVKFRIEPVNSLLNGAAVVNEANIYFDFNPPVITEPCVFSVNTSVGVKVSDGAAMLVYPNPAEDVLTVVLDEAPAPGTIVHVRDVTGRVVLRAPMRSVRTELPIKTLRAGAYRLEVVGGTERWNAGFIKR